MLVPLVTCKRVGVLALQEVKATSRQAVVDALREFEFVLED